MIWMQSIAGCAVLLAAAALYFLGCAHGFREATARASKIVCRFNRLDASAKADLSSLILQDEVGNDIAMPDEAA